MSMFRAPAPDKSWLGKFVALAVREPNSFGQLETRKSDTRVDTTKWFWNGEQCCNPWQRF